MRNIILSLVVCAVLLDCFASEAQQPKTPRVGYLGGSATANPDRLEAFRLGLRELGYIEGKSILLELRFPEGDSQREHAVAAELVRLHVDVIVTVGSNATRAAKEATVTIPIVMTQDPDPVGNKFVASLGHPAGNVTGLSNLNRELSGKRLELLKEIVPRLSRVAVFGTSTQPGHPQARKETELASAALGVKLQYLDVLEPKDIETAFRAATKGRAEAILGLGGALLNLHRSQVVELAAKHRLPAMYNIRTYVEGGG
ncbi:MAG TPA: ABC transporter substrate-binding protein, partial [Candidatus Binatia bacterium]|nr:ABC transporter substrate-binding protein [Candidatus Binatia bacterium]